MADSSDFYSFASRTTTLFVRGIGNLPVLQGDPKWLPPDAIDFICHQASIMHPSAIWLCNGSVYEADHLRDVLVKQGVMEKLTAYSNVYLARTDPRDVARVEKQTFISTTDRSTVEANRLATTECELVRWISRNQLEAQLSQRFPGCMRGRTMYVIPFSMGPIAGPFSKVSIQLTDSPYVVINMRIVSRVSSALWDTLATGTFIRCVHSVGCPRPLTRPPHNGWLCDSDRTLVAHLLPELEVYSYGSGYGGNSLLGKKCLSLRVGSFLGYHEGWLAEHAALLSLTSPEGKEIFFCVSMPSGVGKTVLAMMIPVLPKWKIQIFGDDITWLRFNKDGILCAMAPENGMFGIAAETRFDSGKKIIEMISKDSLLVNAASTNKGRFMWQGLENQLEGGEEVLTWKREKWNKTDKVAHPNCRFSAFTSAAPNVHPNWDGRPVPISAYIWGSRRPDEFPLVFESNSWQAGVTLASTMRTQVGDVSDMKSKSLVHDPFSMRPFMSYNFSNYVKHWLSLGKDKKMPQTFHVNWYQTDEKGAFLWPGFGENIRVLEWIFKRVTEPNLKISVKTSIGHFPTQLNMKGLADLPMEKLIKMEPNFWKKELDVMQEFITGEMGNERPPEVDAVIDEMRKGIA